MGPLVSVIVCSYNAGAYLAAAVQSVLAQTHRNLELLLVDDGSTDGSVESLRLTLDDPRVRWMRQENAGKPVALNRALAESRGEFYALHDADDVSHPRRIERLLTTMEAHPAAAAAYSGHELILDGRRIAPTFVGKDPEACRRDIERFRMPAHDPTGMYRMSLVGRLRYEPALPIVEGFDYVLRVGEQWPMVVVGECLYGYRVHGESVTKKDPGRRDRLVWEVLRRACRRRGIDVATRFPHVGREPPPQGEEERDNGLAVHFMESACDLKRSGRRWEALKVGLECARLHPLALHYHKALIYSATPRWHVTGSRRLVG